MEIIQIAKTSSLLCCAASLSFLPLWYVVYVWELCALGFMIVKLRTLNFSQTFLTRRMCGMGIKDMKQL